MQKKLSAHQCKTCGHQSLIPHGYCPKCRGKDGFQAIWTDGMGTIFSFTRIFVAEERFQAETPYVLAVIESVEGIRLLARIKNEDSEKIAIGAAVELEGWKDEVPIFKIS